MATLAPIERPDEYQLTDAFALTSIPGLRIPQLCLLMVQVSVKQPLRSGKIPRRPLNFRLVRDAGRQVKAERFLN